MLTKMLSTSLIAVMTISPMWIEVAMAKSKTDKSTQRTEMVKARVADLGVGTEVTVIRKQGEPVKGRIEAVEDEVFVLNPKGGTSQRTRYGEVQRIDPVRLSYRQAGQSDPAEVRRVVVGLGIGKKIKMTTSDQRRVQGRIQTIEKDNFAFADSATGATQVAYSDVTRLEAKGLSTGAKVAIIAVLVMYTEIRLVTLAVSDQ